VEIKTSEFSIFRFISRFSCRSVFLFQNFGGHINGYRLKNMISHESSSRPTLDCDPSVLRPLETENMYASFSYTTAHSNL